MYVCVFFYRPPCPFVQRLSCYLGMQSRWLLPNLGLQCGDTTMCTHHRLMVQAHVRTRTCTRTHAPDSYQFEMLCIIRLPARRGSSANAVGGRRAVVARPCSDRNKYCRSVVAGSVLRFHCRAGPAKAISPTWYGSGSLQQMDVVADARAAVDLFSGGPP